MAAKTGMLAVTGSKQVDFFYLFYLAFVFFFNLVSSFRFNLDQG